MVKRFKRKNEYLHRNVTSPCRVSIIEPINIVHVNGKKNQYLARNMTSLHAAAVIGFVTPQIAVYDVCCISM
jgi:hypothetical protein